LAVVLAVVCLLARRSAAADPDVERLAGEVAERGWILFAAKTSRGDYDLFLSRPDGSNLRNLTNTPQINEYGGRFSPDGSKVLYRRLNKAEKINHDLWGQFGELVVANNDGSNPVAQGKSGEYPWASWSPDGRQIACLYRREGKIRILDFATRQVVKEMPRQGIFQQMFWSPDGKRLCGTANVNGADWNIITVDVETGKSTLLTRQLNCTPDWFNDSRRVIYSNRTPGLADGYGWTMLMQATADGTTRTLVYAEREKHIYFGCTSPDDKYVIFSIMPHDTMIESPMAVIRLSDAPIIVSGDKGYKELEALYPTARKGPVLRLTNLPEGFEPQWTSARIGEK
jgi:Tol biopolymer transport system component